MSINDAAELTADHLSNKTGGWFDGAGKSTPSDDPSLPGLLTLSRGTAVLLLLTYLAYLVFQLRTHANLFEAEEDEEETPTMDKWSSAIWLCIVTVVTAFSADVLVGSIDETAQQWHLPSQ